MHNIKVTGVTGGAHPLLSVARTSLPSADYRSVRSLGQCVSVSRGDATDRDLTTSLVRALSGEWARFGMLPSDLCPPPPSPTNINHSYQDRTGSRCR
ncbi:hypothetical protein BgiBS90_029777 [Biomphalaria glabrata]|nr:hypothetical protein BgiBS90_029777 [Biomphalaria glabrata]